MATATPTRIQVVFDAADPARLAEFWAAALHYEVQAPPAGHASWPAFLESIGVPREQWNWANAVVDPSGAGPRIYFQQVDELNPRPETSRVHIDLRVGGGPGVTAEERRRRIGAEAERLCGLGAERVREVDDPQRGEYWLVMQDPEGNRFCLD